MSYKALGDLVKIKGGKRLPKGSQLQSTPNSHPYIRVRDMGEKYIPDNGLEYVPDDVFPAISRYVVNTNDVIISIVGTIGLVSIVDDRFDNASQTENCAKLSGLDEIDANYVYYFLRSSAGQQEIKEGTVGAVQAKLPLYSIEKIKIYWPDREVRKSIVNQLSVLDEKLSINTEINQTLEQMAQAIFKSWFVDFDPIKAKMNGEQPEGMDAATASLFPEKLVESELGLIPEGWEVSQLSDICKNHSQSYNLKSADEVVFVNTGDVQEGDFLHKNYSPVVGLPGQAKKAIKEDDILYSEIRPKNKRFAYVDFDVSDYVVSTKFMVIQANEKVHPRLLYMILTRQNTIDEFNIIADSRSGTFPQITFKAISNLEFCMAPREIQDAFVSQIMPMIKLQSSLKSENKQLAEMRDTLLPKLLSGETNLAAMESV